ncbi:MAG TPA: hypothetical protein VGM86_32610 [Thermoanaerobaculia bacterium]|jgi:hypothetical protein
MATKAASKPHSALASSAHDALHNQLAPYHERLHAIEAQEQKCKLQRAILKATAASELSQRASELKLSNDAVAHLLNLCW